MPRRKNKASAQTAASSAPIITAEFTQFVSRSLKRNDAELAALHELHQRLHALKAELQARHAPLLLELGRGKIRLVSATAAAKADEEDTTTINTSPKNLNSDTSLAAMTTISPSASAEQRETVIVDRLVGTTDASVALVDELQQQAVALAETTGPLIPLYDIAVSFLLHSKLRKRLLNRLARRLLRVAHALDTSKIPEVPALPMYGDLALHVDPQAVAAHTALLSERDRVWQQQQKFRQIVGDEEKEDKKETPTSEAQAAVAKAEETPSAAVDVKKDDVIMKEDDKDNFATKSEKTDDAMETEPVTSNDSEKLDKKLAKDDDANEKTSPKEETNAAEQPNEDASPPPPVSRPSHKTLSACMPRHEYQCFLEYKEAYEKEIPSAVQSNDDDNNQHTASTLQEPQYTFAQKQADSNNTQKEDYELIPLGSVGIGGNPQARMMTTMAERQAEFQRWKSALWQKIPQQPFLPAHVYHYKARLKKAQELYEVQKKQEEAEMAKQMSTAKPKVTPVKVTGGKSLRLMKQEHDAAMEAKAAQGVESHKKDGDDKADVEMKEEGKPGTTTTLSESDDVAMKDAEEPAEKALSTEEEASLEQKEDTAKAEATSAEQTVNVAKDEAASESEKAAKDDTPNEEVKSSKSKEDGGKDDSVSPNKSSDEKIAEPKAKDDAKDHEDTKPPEKATKDTESSEKGTTGNESSTSVGPTSEAEATDKAQKAASEEPSKTATKEDSSLDGTHEDIAEGEEMKEERDGGMEDDELEDDDFSEEEQKAEPMEVDDSKSSGDKGESQPHSEDDQATKTKVETASGDETTNAQEEAQQTNEEVADKSLKNDADETIPIIKEDTAEAMDVDQKDGEGVEASESEKLSNEKKKDEEDKSNARDDDESKEAESEANEPKDAAMDEESDEDLDPLKSLNRPISLIPTPSFYDQDLKRIRMVHAELMGNSIREHVRRRMEDVTREYNNALRTSNQLYEQRQRYQQQLNELINQNRSYMNSVQDDYNRKYVHAHQQFQARQSQHNAQKLNYLMPNRHNPQHFPEGTAITNMYMRQPDPRRQIVAQYLGSMVDAVSAVASGQKQNAKFQGTFIPPPKPDTHIDHKKRMEEQVRNELNNIGFKLRASEEDRSRAWKRMMKAKAECDTPQASGHRRIDYNAVQLPPLRQSTTQSIPHSVTYATSSAAAYVPRAPQPLHSNMAGEEGSKYAAARVRARIAPDGSVAPVATPKRGKDGLFIRPAGRKRSGMAWDAHQGVWVPDPQGLYQDQK